LDMLEIKDLAAADIDIVLTNGAHSRANLMPETITTNTGDLKRSFKGMYRKAKTMTATRAAVEGRGEEWKDNVIYIFEQPCGNNKFPDYILCWGQKNVTADTTADTTTVHFLYGEAKNSETIGKLVTNSTARFPDVLYFVGRYILAGTCLTSTEQVVSDYTATAVGQVLNTKLSAKKAAGEMDSSYKYRQTGADHWVPDIFIEKTDVANSKAKEVLRKSHVVPMLNNWLNGFDGFNRLP
jgi:hypothetical protein